MLAYSDWFQAWKDFELRVEHKVMKMQILGIGKPASSARIRARAPATASHLRVAKLAPRAKSLHGHGVNYTLAIM